MNSPADVMDLAPVLAAINQAADDQAMVVLNGIPYGPVAESGFWHDGDWQAFLNIAERVGVAILYIQSQPYDPERFTVESSKLPPPASLEDEDLEQLQTLQAEVAKKVRSSIKTWDQYAKMLGRVSVTWFNAGIAHEWEMATSWMINCEDKAEAVSLEVFRAYIEKAKELPERSEQAIANGKLMHELAVELARHPRFTDATSEHKRQFMAEQLFGDQLVELEKTHTAPLNRIADRAALIYWWAIGPAEQEKLAARALSLNKAGDSKRSIAAKLHISEARVETLLSTSATSL